ncbi:MAG TPA: hypothetical protein VFQ44_04905 [Streptosporangiaceae bacterium]|nr:hypothetical protein [Streptosporangiaceae bacterium]
MASLLPLASWRRQLGFLVMDDKFDADALRTLSEDERRQLLHQLVDAEQGSAVKPGTSWKWDLLLVLIIGGCLLLAAWIGYLAVSLPAFYRTGSWRGAWVGFDLAELGAFAVTGWAAWRRRQILIICLIVLATLLLCDAWFDVVLDARTAGFVSSLISALAIEVPIALLALYVARRLLKLTIGQVIKYEGGTGPVPSLWRVSLFGTEDGTSPLERLIKAAKTEPELGDTPTTQLKQLRAGGAPRCCENDSGVPHL